VVREFGVHVRADRDLVHVEPTGDLDIATSAELREILGRLAAERFAGFAIDLRGLDFIDSQGVRVLVAFERDARRDGRRLTLVQGAPVVSRIFELSGTLELLPFAPASDPAGHVA
jgi:anti-anti-sigma factor